MTTARNRRSTATARLMCAAAALTGANGRTRERRWGSASGEIAGAILRRSHQI
jgi:hypothetical protein